MLTWQYDVNLTQIWYTECNRSKLMRKYGANESIVKVNDRLHYIKGLCKIHPVKFVFLK